MRRDPVRRDGMRRDGARAALVRRAAALVGAALLLVPLTSCASGQPEGCAASGGASGVVEATGDLGTEPDVSFPQPLRTDGVESSVVSAGDSGPLRDGQPVLLEATILNGDDGSVLQRTAYTGDGILFTVGDEALPALGDGLVCAEIGSRIAIVSPPDGPSGDEPGAPGSLVYVVDVISAFQARADGPVQPLVAGLPSVVTAPDGTPGVTIPNEDAPSDYREAVIREGDGAEIEEDDAVVVKVSAFDWESNSVATSIPSTWETGSSTVWALGQDASLGEGAERAVVGQRVGSQVLAVVPPELAGGGGQAPPPTGPQVLVVDILGTIEG